MYIYFVERHRYKLLQSVSIQNCNTFKQWINAVHRYDDCLLYWLFTFRILLKHYLIYAMSGKNDETGQKTFFFQIFFLFFYSVSLTQVVCESFRLFVIPLCFRMAMILPLTEEVYSWICFNSHFPYFGHGDTKAIFFLFSFGCYRAPLHI